MPAPPSGPSKCGRAVHVMRTVAATAGLALLAAALLVVTATAGAGGPAKYCPRPQGKVYTWYEGSRPESAWLAADEFAVFFRPGSGVTAARMAELARLVDPGARVLAGSNEYVMFARLGPGGAAGDLVARAARRLAAQPEVREVSPVFYQGARTASDCLALTGEVAARFRAAPASRVARVAGAYGLQTVKAVDYAPNTCLLRADSAWDSLTAANQLRSSGAVDWATPDWWRARATRSIPDDPLFVDQWNLRNTGQGGGTRGADIDITPVWDQFKGSHNQVVAIVDDGLQIGHPDLKANVIPGQSWDWVDDNADPSPGSGDDHGTACAGVAAARGFNGIGVSGAAPHAGLVGFRMLDADSDSVEADALTRGQSVVDIDSCSWGPLDDRHLEAPGPLAEAALADGVQNGRQGKGTIYVWAGGNGRLAHDNSNYDGYANSRYTIAVGACTNTGKQANYSEPGANLIVTAPSSGGSLDITTTDRTGGAGYSSGDYTHSFGGTSAAAPLVSGVVALMLQANPDLTWRDVQQILMTTATKNDPSEPDWTTNGVGYHINHKFGFGRVDAQAAVDAAEGWVTAGPEVTDQGSSAPHLPIPDADPNGVSDTITLSKAVKIEWVDVYFTATHPFWADLQVVLTSPEGTQSVLADASLRAGAASTYNDWRFGVARCFGEDSQGTWTLTVRDLQAGDTGTFDSWSIQVFGTAAGSDSTPPITTVSGADHGWHNSNVSLTLSATDNPGGSGVDRTLYKIDGGAWQTGATVLIAAPKDHSDDGRHRVSYHSVDNAGNWEAVKTCTVKIDTRGPTTSAPRPCTVVRGFRPALSYRADDLLSPRADVTIRVYQASRLRKVLHLGWRRTDKTHVTGMSVWRCRLPRGTYRYTVLATDLAGNTQTKAGSNRLIVR